MKNFLAILLFFFCSISYAQPSLVWNKSINSSNNEALDMQSDDLGFLYVLTKDSILKYNFVDGKIIWSRQFDVYLLSSASEMKVEKDGTVIVCGTSEANSNKDILVEKINANGNLDWRKYYNGQGNVDDIGYSIDTDSIGNIFLVGKTDLTLLPSTFHTPFYWTNDLELCKGILLKYSASGVLLQSYIKSNSIPASYGANAILKVKIDNNGSVIIGGYDYTKYQGFINAPYSVWTGYYYVLENCVDTVYGVGSELYRYRKANVSKLDNSLNLIWEENILGGPIHYDCNFDDIETPNDVVRDIVINNNNEIFVSIVGLWSAQVNYSSGDKFMALNNLRYRNVLYKFSTTGNYNYINSIIPNISFDHKQEYINSELKYNSNKDEIHFIANNISTNWKEVDIKHQIYNSSSTLVNSYTHNFCTGYKVAFYNDTMISTRYYRTLSTSSTNFYLNVYDSTFNIISNLSSWSNGKCSPGLANTGVRSAILNKSSVYILFDKSCKNNQTNVLLQKYCISKPSINILNSDTLICIGDSVQLNSTISNFNEFWWKEKINISDTSITNPIVYPNSNQKYTLYADKSGCIVSKDINIDVAGISLNQKDIDTNMCYLDSINLNVLNYKIDSYLWSNGDTSSSVIAYGDSLATYQVNTTDVCGFIDSVRFDIEPNYFCRKVCGNVFADYDSNCINNSPDINLKNWIVRAVDGVHYASTDSNGNYSVNLNKNENTIELIIPQNYRNYVEQICPDSTHYVYVDSLLNDTCGLDFSLEGYDTCISMQVNISSGRLRRCPTHDHFYYLSYCNNSFDTARNVTITVDFDTLIDVTGGELTPVNIVGNAYTYFIGDVAPFYCSKSYKINHQIKCSANIGGTICVKAIISASNSCSVDTASAGWDKSSVAVEGSCLNDSIIRFVIYNTGDFGVGDMQIPSEYRVYEDSSLVTTGSFQLVGGDSLVIHVLGNGSSIRLEADQHPNHPGASFPNSVVDGCGGNDTVIILSQFYTDDEELDVDIYCDIVRSSYDPNEKDVFPQGITSNHFVKPNRKLEYTIHFQNTGNDTAFVVVLSDSLPMELDVSTIELGASSHSFEYKVSGIGQPVLNFTFNKINLPDSTTDLAGSEGFVNFKAKPYSWVSNGTVVNNNVDIYFDRNSPIRTNDAWVTIFDTNIVGGTIHIIECDTSTLPIFGVYPTDTVVCLGQNVNVTSIGGDKFIWSPNIDISDTSISNPVISTLIDRNYSVEVWDSTSCYSKIENLIIDVYDTIPQAEFSYQLTGFEVSLTDSSSSDANSWYWSIGNDSVSNTTTGQYTFTQDGTYDVCLIASNDCFSDTICKQLTITGVGINEVQTQGNIKVYPNPVTNQLTIELKDSDRRITSVQLIDINGRVVSYQVNDKGIASTSSRNDGIVIDVSQLTKGLYIYEILSDEEIIGIGEIIKK